MITGSQARDAADRANAGKAEQRRHELAKLMMQAGDIIQEASEAGHYSVTYGVPEDLSSDLTRSLQEYGYTCSYTEQRGITGEMQLTIKW